MIHTMLDTSESHSTIDAAAGSRGRARTWALFLTLASLAFLHAPAQADDTTWHLRFGASWVDVDGRSDQTLAGGARVSSDADSDLGLSVTAEYRPNDRIGIEFGAPIIASPTLSVRVTQGGTSVRLEDDFDLNVLVGGINFHLTPGKKLDLYLGPFVGWGLLSDLAYVTPDEDDPVVFTVDDELAYGFVVGLDVPLGDRWTFGASARYLELAIDPVGPDGGADTVDLDTLAVGVGLGVRF